jgi:hypothetical protein
VSKETRPSTSTLVDSPVSSFFPVVILEGTAMGPILFMERRKDRSASDLD